MVTERAPRAWTSRPSLFISRMLGFALAMLIALIAVFLMFTKGQMLWALVAVPVAIWVGFKGGPLLLRLLERLGLFGRVRIEAGRLEVGRWSRAIQLGDPFEVDARLQTSNIEREYNLKDLGVTSTKRLRKHTLRVRVFTVLAAQDDVRVQFVADETNRSSGPDYETAGMAVRPLPAVNADATKVRLWGADLAELLGQLCESPGYATPAVGEQPEPREDPRKAFCPTWKVAVGVVAILAVFVVGSFTAYQGYVERLDAEWAELEAEAERQRQEAETAVKPLVGRRVVVDAGAGDRIVGTVESYRLIKSMTLSREFEMWHAEVSLVVTELLDEDGRALPADMTVSHRFTTEEVRRGDRLEYRADDIELWEDRQPEDPQ